MPRATVTTCVSCGWRRAEIVISTRNMKGELQHELSLCGACSSQPMVIEDRMLMHPEEVASYRAQKARAAAERRGDFERLDMVLVAKNALGIS